MLICCSVLFLMHVLNFLRTFLSTVQLELEMK